MSLNIFRNNSEKQIEKAEKRIENAVEQIVQKGHRNSWRNLPKRQIEFIKLQIIDTIHAYPPKVRPIVASIMTLCYFSVIPGAGTASLLFFGGIGKIIKKFKKT